MKILHTIYEDTTFKDREVSWNEPSKQRNKLIDIETINLDIKTNVIEDENGTEIIGRRIKWIELAKQYNIPFKKTIHLNSLINHFPQKSFPKYLVGLSEGILENHENFELVKLLEPFCNNENCYFYYDSLVLGNPEREDLHFGKLSNMAELISNGKMTLGYSPTYVWPIDKSWCFNTDWDLSFSVIGCSRKVAEILLSSEVLETIEVERRTRIDYRADEE